MRSLKDTDKIVIENYTEAEKIYSLARKKVSLNTGEKIAEAAIFLFTPFVNGIKGAHALSDLGIYYLVEQDRKQLLVRVAKSEKEDLIKEKDITGDFIGEDYIVGNDKFEKIREIKNG